MGSARVRLNHAGISAVLHSPGVTADLQRRMGPVLAWARAAAPVESGAYRDSLHIVTVQRASRVAVQVVADVPYAMSVEAATGNLARALDAAGGEGGDLSKVKRSYTTKSGKTIMATQAQIDNWTRGRT